MTRDHRNVHLNTLDIYMGPTHAPTHTHAKLNIHKIYHKWRIETWPEDMNYQLKKKIACYELYSRITETALNLNMTSRDTCHTGLFTLQGCVRKEDCTSTQLLLAWEDENKVNNCNLLSSKLHQVVEISSHRQHNSYSYRNTRYIPQTGASDYTAVLWE